MANQHHNVKKPNCNWCWNCPECITAHVKFLKDNGVLPVSQDGVMMTHPELAQVIDHTALKADIDFKTIETLCIEAMRYNFASVCVNPTWVRFCKEMLKGTDVVVCTVVGFPLGAMTGKAKAAETKDAVANGAREIDMVFNIGRLKSEHYDVIQDEIEAVVKAAGEAHVKVIIETCYLADLEKIKACELAKAAGAHFVKTSTGFGSGGATTADVALMRRVVGESMGVKASGGIRDAATAETMIKAGANRLGVSAGVAIVTK